MNPLQGLQLMQKYGSLKTADLTVDVLREVTGALGLKVDVDAPTTQSVIHLLSENNVDGVADLLSHQELLPKVLSLFRAPPQPRGIVRECNHCGKMNYYEVTP